MNSVTSEVGTCNFSLTSEVGTCSEIGTCKIQNALCLLQNTEQTCSTRNAVQQRSLV